VRTKSIPALVIAALLSLPVASQSAELRGETLNAWNEYIRAVQVRAEARATSGDHFLWIDDLPGGAQRARSGEIVVAPVRGSGSHSVPHGLIYDWIGTMFVPDANIDQVFSVVRDYNQYKNFYAPVVIESRTLTEAPDQQTFSMLWQQKVAFVTAAMASDYKSTYIRVDDNRWYNIAYSTRVQQVEHYGSDDETRLPPDHGSGYIWRLYSIARFERRSGGVFVEMEVVGLSRDIPFTVRWIVDPIVSQLPKSSITASLKETRDAVRTVVAKSKPRDILNDPSTVANLHLAASQGRAIR
jgi:hypothetical protein